MPENEWVLGQRTPVGDPSTREEQGPGREVRRTGEASKVILRGRRGKPRALGSDIPNLWSQVEGKE